MIDDTLPCPFCGAMPEINMSVRDTGGMDGHDCFLIACKNRDCRVNPSVVAYGPSKMTGQPGWVGGQRTSEEAAELVAKWWNTRVSDATTERNEDTECS